MLRFLTLTFIFFIPAGLLAQVPMDFDGDGVSDVPYTVSSGSDLLWKSDASFEDGPELNETFGLTTDKPVMAHWLGDDLPFLGVIRERTSDSTLVWKVLLGGGVLQEEIFGKSGDVCLAGGDFDGDGFGDAAVVRGSNALIWEIKNNLFNSPGKSKRFKFGKRGERVFYASPDGVRDWIGTFGPKGKRSLLKLRDTRSKETISSRRIPKLLAKDPRPRPVPLKQADGSDYLVFALPDESDTTLYTYDLEGNLINKTTLAGLGTLIVGDFIVDEEGWEIGLQVTSKLRVFNPVTGVSEERDVVSGTPVDEITVVEVGTVATAVPTATATPS